MGDLFDFFLQLISQFAGGMGQLENNLVRFSIPAVTYGVLLWVAWSRQREQDLPREKMLVWGFAMGSASGIVMASFVALQMLEIVDRQEAYAILVPVQRGLLMASVVVVAGAFLRYILDDARLALRYIGLGLALTAVCLVIALVLWPGYLAVYTEARFHNTWVSWVFQVASLVLTAAAIFLVRRKRGWLPDVVTVALSFFVISDLFFMLNYGSNLIFNRYICPIGNLFPILASFILGYVYIREQALETRRAKKDLEAYRDHLEELVTERTEELTRVNDQLTHEVGERRQTEGAFARLSRQYELILESAGEGICGIDREGHFTFVNAAAADALGYSVEDLVGQHSSLILHHTQKDHSHYPEGRCPIYDGYTYGLPSRSDDYAFWRKDNTSLPVFFVVTPTFENGTLTGAVVVFKDITERKQAEAEAAQRSANLAAQNTIAAALSRSIELETVLDTALDAVLSIVKMEVGLIFLWDAEGELGLRSYRGSIFEQGPTGPVHEWHCCAAISMEAMGNSQAVVKAIADCPDVHASPMIARQGLQTLVSVPLAAGGAALGALTLVSRRQEPIRQPELELLTIIGQQIGMAVENAHLFWKAERAAEELALLHDVSTVLTSTFSTDTIYGHIAEQSVRLLTCHAACVLALDEDGQAPRLLSSYGFHEADFGIVQSALGTAGFIDQVLKRHESVALGDALADPRLPDDCKEKLNVRALLCVPIRGMEQSLGCLFLLDRKSTRRWRQEEIVLIESFVNRAAVALMNADLHKKLEYAAALEERQRIAADMHDGLAQTVSLLGLQIEGAMELAASGEGQQAVEELAVTRDTVERVSVEVRKSIASLQKPAQPRRPIQDLLADLPQQLAWGDGQPVELVFEIQEPLYLPQDQSEQALLVVQEALVNAHRHAHAEHIWLKLKRRRDEIVISVEDDGAGFRLGSWWEKAQDHFGLSVMHSRAARIGAGLQVDSIPGHGTRVTLTLPLPERPSLQPAAPDPQEDALQPSQPQGVAS